LDNVIFLFVLVICNVMQYLLYYCMFEPYL